VARRIVEYWDHRKRFFGERWLLPLTLTGAGAMDTDDIALIKYGFSVLLHDQSGDGRLVLYTNRCRLTTLHNSVSSVSKLRCLFFLLSVASLNDCSRTAGIHIVSYFGDDIPDETYDKEVSRKALDLLVSGSIPVRIRSSHLINLTARSNKHLLTSRNTLFAAVQLLERWKFLNSRTIVHSGNSPDDIIASLKKYGFTDKAIPEQSGGMWSYEQDLSAWLKSVRVVNQRIPAKPACKSGTKRPAKTMKSQDENADKEKIRLKKRAMDAVYARRKRERQRIEIEVLQERCFAISNKNQSLRDKNAKLEALIQEAEEAVQHHERYGAMEVLVAPIEFRGTMDNESSRSGYGSSFLSAAFNTGLQPESSNTAFTPFAGMQFNSSPPGSGTAFPPSFTPTTNGDTMESLLKYVAQVNAQSYDIHH
jgi:hypothetical protein